MSDGDNMAMDRRAFIQGAAIVAAAPFIADLVSLTTFAQSNAAEVMHRPSAEMDLRPVELRIQGWHVNRFTAPARETAAAIDHMRGGSEIDEVLVSVNRAWRSAWR
jgi:hypothetical protein